MRRFETPPAPPRWTSRGATLIRIVDPLGGAIAWLAPDYGGACVGYAIRRDEDDGARWYQILHAGGRREWRADTLNTGIAVLGPDADNLVAASQARWQLVERDPTAATCSARLDGMTLFFTARLEASALHLDLRAEQPERARPPTLGLRLTFADSLRRDGGGSAGSSLRVAGTRLRMALDPAGQDTPRWTIDETASGVAAEFVSQESIALVLWPIP